MNKIYKLSTQEQKLLLKILAQLIAVDSSQKNESQVSVICERYLKSWGVKFQKFQKIKGRHNLVWSLGKGAEILVAAHSDIVPAGEGWETNPFKLFRKSGKLYGRGVVDNKSPLAGILLATKILKKFENELKNKITFAAVADEERGNKFGMDYLLEQKVFQPVMAIIPDSCGNNRKVEIAEKGALQLKVVAFGKQGHGSMPEKSKNAIFILSDFIQQARNLRFTKKTKLLSSTTISVGGFHAGNAVNVIPGEAEALLDIRFPPNESGVQILKKLKQIAAVESKKWKVRKFRFEILANLSPSETSEKSPIVQKSCEAIKRVSHKKTKVVGIPAFTLGGVLRSKNIPVVGFGPGDSHECHRANEKVRENEVYEFCEILIELLKKISNYKN